MDTNAILQSAQNKLAIREMQTIEKQSGALDALGTLRGGIEPMLMKYLRDTVYNFYSPKFIKIGIEQELITALMEEAAKSGEKGDDHV